MNRRPLTLYNSLTRSAETFAPIDPTNVRVYSCGPTVYHYAHIGNLRAYVFTDTLSRVLTWKARENDWGPLTHVINITDVGHLTSDADAGDDKMEAAAKASGRDIWEISRHYTDAFKRNLIDLGVRPPSLFPLATDHIAEMIAWGQAIEPDHCYRLPDGLYFDTTSVPAYGSLARQVVDEGEGRIDPVAGKRHAADFAIWRTSGADEHRQMEWDSPWGRGAPGWHLECSVMSAKYLGPRFDIHTGGIDHREIHHPNEIAQNQAHCGCGREPGFTGASFWMHNNFLVERTGKMSKSSGAFTTLQTLVDRGFYPLAYRLMCLQAHYRSEMEFSWDGLSAAATRLKRLVQTIAALRDRPAAPSAGGNVVVPRAARRRAVGRPEHAACLARARRDAGGQADRTVRSPGCACRLRRVARSRPGNAAARGPARPSGERDDRRHADRRPADRPPRRARGEGLRCIGCDPRRPCRGGGRGDGRRSARLGVAGQLSGWSRVASTGGT